ncbi:unnamed protein product [Owenia fusiformis]|uniref:Uncharacterized protein n=1 Tax=Owenia fusiformis TaxID=6347 RepID=A0A8J1UZ57_OWEFU|nr:unnamed protein product [Owenia fusiformis]
MMTDSTFEECAIRILLILSVASVTNVKGLSDNILAHNKECSVKPLMLHVEPPPEFAKSCRPTQVLSMGCRGQCASYSSINADLTSMDKVCTCCQLTKSGVQQVILSCDGGRHIRRLIKYARECICRPCLDRQIVKHNNLENVLNSVRP